jgi:hypothetical protein
LAAGQDSEINLLTMGRIQISNRQVMFHPYQSIKTMH